MPFPPNDDSAATSRPSRRTGNTNLLRPLRGQRRQRVLGTTTEYLRHAPDPPRAGEWPGRAPTGRRPNGCPDTVNSADSIDQEPRITPGRQDALFHERVRGTRISGSPRSSPTASDESPGYRTQRPTQKHEHCFCRSASRVRTTRPYFISVRPREAGRRSTADVYTHQEDRGLSGNPPRDTKASCSTRSV